jgi:hypothetical protein
MSKTNIKYTNKHGLPEAFVRAAVNDPYDAGDCDFTPSSLGTPPRALALLRSAESVEVDVSSRVDAIIGNGAHSIAERAARPGVDICEKRYFAKFEVDGQTYTVSAQIDLYETDTGHLQDWKTTKAYAFSKKAGGKAEWAEQMNICAELMRRNGLTPKKLTIIGMLKDWNKKDAEAGDPGMPRVAVVAQEQVMWDSAAVVKHIEDRIRAHVAAKKELPACTPGETWGGRRCAQWCDASSVCDQFKQSQKTGLISISGDKNEVFKTRSVARTR